MGDSVRVVSCYEAGRDGFWLHRELRSWGIENLVIDAGSMERSVRRRRVKTDRIDGEKLLREGRDAAFERCRRLMQLRGIGIEGGWVLPTENKHRGYPPLHHHVRAGAGVSSVPSSPCSSPATPST